MNTLLLLLASAPSHDHRRLPPAVVPVPVVVPAPVLVQRPPTVEEFAKTFTPLPGSYKVCLLHPKSCQPVEVCFTLPDCGCPKVHVNKHHLEFDYGKHEVDIRFRHNGSVDVKAK